jgi:predicted aspartyl protease
MRVMWAFLFALGVLWTALPADADTLPTADEIRAKNDAFTGPKPKNYRETIVALGEPGTSAESRRTTFRSDDDVRHTFDSGGIHSEYGTYHGEDWVQNENGLVIADAKDPGKAVPDKITTTVRRVSTPVDAYVISELNVRSAGTRSYYDPVTFRLLRIEDVGPGGTETTTFDDVERFGDRNLAAHWRVVSGDAERRYERRSYVAGAASDDDVRQPGTRRLLVEFPAGVDHTDLPIQIKENNVFVRVKIGGRTADFLLDTGADSIVLEHDFARDLGLQLTNAHEETVARHYTGYQAIVPEMHIGPLVMHQIVADVVSSLPAGYADSTIRPVGLLGFDFLAQLGVTIDYEKSKVTVVPAGSFQPPVAPGMLVLDVRLGDAVPMLTVKIGNAVGERVLLDTGGSLAFFIQDYFARRYPQSFPPSQHRGSSEMVGVGGSFPVEVYRLPDVQLGRVHFKDFLAMVVPASAAYSDQVDGVIGNEVLSKFVVILDYTDGEVFLVPTRATQRKLTPVKS